MTEHENHHKIQPIPDEAMNHDMLAEKNNFNQLIPITLLVGALLIAGGIFFGDQAIGRAISGLNGASQLTAMAPSPAAAPSPAPSAAPPAGPVSVASRKDQPTEGKSGAKVTIVEFGDFQCPFCKSFFQNTLPQIKSTYIDTGKAQLIFRHFPLTQLHVNAQISAVAAECANQQGKFWPYHDLLYTNGQADGTNLDKLSLEKYADQLGLNKGTLGFGKNKFNQCLESNATLATVNADQTEGTKDGVSGTPSFFINGQLLVGTQPFSSFQTAIDNALKQ